VCEASPLLSQFIPNDPYNLNRHDLVLKYLSRWVDGAGYEDASKANYFPLRAMVIMCHDQRGFCSATILGFFDQLLTCTYSVAPHFHRHSPPTGQDISIPYLGRYAI